MRILYFSADYTTHDWRFLQELSRSEHQVFFLRLQGSTSGYEQRPLPAKIENVEWPSGRTQMPSVASYLHLVPDLEAVLEQTSPDLIHAGPIQSCGFIAALSTFHPLLVMSWGSDILLEADRDPLANWITRYTLNGSDGLICDCEAVKTRVNELVDYGQRPVTQFPWGVDLEAFDRQPKASGLRQQLGWENEFILISTRSWEEIYAIDVLLEGFYTARKTQSKLRLILLGDGALAGWVAQFIHDHGLGNDIHMPGRISYDLLPEYFQAADLYVSTAYSDGSSVSLLEAMATHLPVVVTDAAGNREWISSRNNGWLTPPGNHEALSEMLLSVTNMDRHELTTIGSRNREIVERRADWGRNFPQLLETYDLLNRRRIS